MELARAAIYRGDDDAKAFFAERLPIAHQYLGEFGYRVALDDAQFARRHLRQARDFLAVFDIEDRRVVGDDDIFTRGTGFHRHIAVHAQHVVVTVDGEEELRSDLAMDPKRLFLVAVAGGVHIARLIRNDVRTLAREIVFHFLHGAFVAGNDRRREHDSVLRRERDVLVRLIRDPHERGKFVALRAGCEHDNFLRRVFAHVFCLNDRTVFEFEEAELSRDLEIGFHRAAVDDDLTAHLLRYAHNVNEAFEL